MSVRPNFTTPLLAILVGVCVSDYEGPTWYLGPNDITCAVYFSEGAKTRVVPYAGMYVWYTTGRFSGRALDRHTYHVSLVPAGDTPYGNSSLATHLCVPRSL
ncbi:hypothetical protein QBC46DRAFT_392322 [Diplogelasinospora grovesii]|uniref:Uncharacterized protein n=1 Tax=Diplogelasinospora grovesii TaxID=303347 RepID=A0AAN6N4I4_9PEZI|nr:hypothetical protein QBC46DRAFT_392322 [Diplogelasinospora grovesii]